MHTLKRVVKINILFFASTDKNGKGLENYTELWHEIKKQIESVSGNKVIKCDKDIMKIKYLTIG